MTQNQIIWMAREAGFHKWYTQPEEHPDHVAIVERFAHLVAAAEREACAKVCDDILREEKCTGASDAAIECSVSIRARSNT